MASSVDIGTIAGTPATYRAAARLPGVARAGRRALPLIDWVTSRVSLDSRRLERLVHAVEPTLSLRDVRARVVAIRLETHDTKTYVLKPNGRFRGFEPGAYLSLRIVVDGEPVVRSYSISSSSSTEGLVAITVKRVDGGIVSNWLFHRLAVGDVVEIGQARGSFLLPKDVPPRILMISAGSGITPVMAMLRHVTSLGAQPKTAFLHFARAPEDIIFRDELAQVAARCPSVGVTICVERAGADWMGPRGRFTAALLEEAAPDFREIPIYLCGPAPFMAEVIKALEATGCDLANLRYEQFTSGADVSAFLATSSLVRFTRSGVETVVSRPRTLLEVAEARGLRPEHGCRMGVCGSCRCEKVRGVVIDITTGRESGDGAESIRPCVSVAKGNVDLDL